MLIERHGAVSREVADAMALGALERFRADTSIAITGIAGPDGGSEEKPWAPSAGARGWLTASVLARDTRMPGDRAEIRDRSATVGMRMLRRLLRGEDLPV